jgi:hypothetical protein
MALVLLGGGPLVFFRVRYIDALRKANDGVAKMDV